MFFLSLVSYLSFLPCTYGAMVATDTAYLCLMPRFKRGKSTTNEVARAIPNLLRSSNVTKMCQGNPNSFLVPGYLPSPSDWYRPCARLFRFFCTSTLLYRQTVQKQVDQATHVDTISHKRCWKKYLNCYCMMFAHDKCAKQEMVKRYFTHKVEQHVVRGNL